MNKFIIFSLALLLFSGCASNDNSSPDTSSDVSSTSITDEEASSQEPVTEPAGDDSEDKLKADCQSRIQNGMTLFQSVYEDFDRDGKHELLCFVIGSDNIAPGELWLSNTSGSRKLSDTTSSYGKLEKFDLEERDIATIQTGEAGIEFIFVKGDNAEIVDGGSLADIQLDKYGNLVAYSWGMTSRPYYYGIVDDFVAELGAYEGTEEQFTSYPNGAELLSKLRSEVYKIDKFLYRDGLNNIISLNVVSQDGLAQSVTFAVTDNGMLEEQEYKFSAYPYPYAHNPEIAVYPIGHEPDAGTGETV